jgi:hypothetical protein
MAMVNPWLPLPANANCPPQTYQGSREGPENSLGKGKGGRDCQGAETTSHERGGPRRHRGGSQGALGQVSGGESLTFLDFSQAHQTVGRSSAVAGVFHSFW